MAIISWDQVKRNIPGVGDRAYIMAGYRLVQGQCVPNPLATDRQCQTFQGYGSSSDVWGQDSPVQTLYPQVGEYLVITQDGQPACYKVLEILDEATFNTGQCTSCYYNGYAGNCSDTLYLMVGLQMTVQIVHKVYHQTLFRILLLIVVTRVRFIF